MTPNELESLIAQNQLNNQGYYGGDLDGRWGPISKRAANAWYSEGLARKTIPVLNATAEVLRAAAAQSLLAKHGYYTGKIDGVWGPLSQAAAARWEAIMPRSTTPAVIPPERGLAPDERRFNQPYDIAKQYLGTREIPGKENNPLIVRWHRRLLSWINDDETAWCSSFANFCAAEAGYESSGKVNARSWLDVGEPVSFENARKGDVVIFWRGSPNGWEGHVAFFEHYNAVRDLLYVLGGNQNNEVNISTYPIEHILGIRRLRSLDRLQGSARRV